MGSRCHGFTLLELLVVVAIIAALISVLLPSLTAARATARASVCAAHLRGAAQGLAVYGSEWRDFIPGPTTSGAHIPSFPTPFTWGERENEPTQDVDWVSPILGDPLSLPTDRDERITAMFNEDFRCPANGERFTHEYAFGPYIPKKGLAYASYSSPIGFHLTHWGKGSGVYEKQVDASLGNVNTSGFPGSKIPIAPRTYGYKTIHVGPPHKKVFAMDGARYITYTGSEFGYVTYNSGQDQDEGGNLMTMSPALAGDSVRTNGSPYKIDSSDPTKLHPFAVQYAYRHPNETLNTIFFDGHYEQFGDLDSRDTSLYFPSGSTIKNAVHTMDPNDTDGMKIN